MFKEFLRDHLPIIGFSAPHIQEVANQYLITQQEVQIVFANLLRMNQFGTYASIVSLLPAVLLIIPEEKKGAMLEKVVSASNYVSDNKTRTTQRAASAARHTHPLAYRIQSML